MRQSIRKQSTHNKITVDSIKEIIKQMKNNMPGHTKMNKTVLQNLSNDTLLIYRKLLNISLLMDYFPDTFKHPKTKLIPKPNKSSTDPLNYRPILLLEVPGKLNEKKISITVCNFLEYNNLLPVTQHDFRKYKSTSSL